MAQQTFGDMLINLGSTVGAGAQLAGQVESRRNSERINAYNMNRQAVADQRAELQFNQQQEDRAWALKQRAEQEAIQKYSDKEIQTAAKGQLEMLSFAVTSGDPLDIANRLNEFNSFAVQHGNFQAMGKDEELMATFRNVNKAQFMKIPIEYVDSDGIKKTRDISISDLPALMQNPESDFELFKAVYNKGNRTAAASYLESNSKIGAVIESVIDPVTGKIKAGVSSWQQAKSIYDDQVLQTEFKKARAKAQGTALANPWNVNAAMTDSTMANKPIRMHVNGVGSGLGEVINGNSASFFDTTKVSKTKPDGEVIATTSNPNIIAFYTDPSNGFTPQSLAQTEEIGKIIFGNTGWSQAKSYDVAWTASIANNSEKYKIGDGVKNPVPIYKEDGKLAGIEAQDVGVYYYGTNAQEVAKTNIMISDMAESGKEIEGIDVVTKSLLEKSKDGKINQKEMVQLKANINSWRCKNINSLAQETSILSSKAKGTVYELAGVKPEDKPKDIAKKINEEAASVALNIQYNPRLDGMGTENITQTSGTYSGDKWTYEYASGVDGAIDRSKLSDRRYLTREESAQTYRKWARGLEDSIVNLRAAERKLKESETKYGATIDRNNGYMKDISDLKSSLEYQLGVISGSYFGATRTVGTEIVPATREEYDQRMIDIELSNIESYTRGVNEYQNVLKESGM
ncbi:hypothetical protein EOL73_00155 [Candidatus Saccharibacteria bacterium]|nr:hypothetical protein [Candidatus Saccharibacteria bacterium]